MPDPGGEVDPIVIRRVGFDNLRSLTQSNEEMRPRLIQIGAIGVCRQRRLGDGERQPRQRLVGIAHDCLLLSVPTLK
ncbi:hypothetical protein [Mycobacterium sp.]|uniref:hypothetical protein n=1 Tax=Mycobacterium sp. TaxID=1785 RepID=UPI00261A440F|nr:hypothetical protein [Mycobacterium sp.]